MLKQNLHTHSIYCDGKDTPAETAETAAADGFSVLGFSGHGTAFCDTVSMSEKNTQLYISEVRRLKEEYRGRMEIFLGVEEDIIQRIPDRSPYDFVIGSCHFIRKNGQIWPLDYSREVFVQILEAFDNDFIMLAEAYYSSVRSMKDFAEIDFIGHLDLLTKYNEDESFVRFDDPAYVRCACDTIDALQDIPFEVNTGAIARGYRRTPYPYANLLKYMQEKGVRVLLNSDCHDRTKLECAFPETLSLIRKCGFSSMLKMTDHGFEEADLGEFLDAYNL